MTGRTNTVTVPEDVYTQLETHARSSARSVDDLVAQTLAHGLPPTAEPDLPLAVQAELNAMEQLSDEADALMVRKAQAYAILHHRGYTLPTLDELHAQTP